MNRSGWAPENSAAAALGVRGTASHGHASTMGCHWFLAVSDSALTVQTRVIAAMPPVRSTLIFMAWFLGGASGLVARRTAQPGNPLKLDLHSFPRVPYGVMLF